MLRYLYRRVLDAHPPCFRQRFAEEMMAIFDESESGWGAARLLADGLISLARQWSLRPQFWEERAATLEAGSALFGQLAEFRPRAVALAYGAVVSAIVLNGISLTMGYAWNHPHYLEIRRPVIVPPASWKNSTTPGTAQATTTEPPLYTGEGRVLLVFNAPPRVEKADAQSKSVVATASRVRDDDLSGAYRAYLGDYRTVAPDGARVNFSVENGRIQVDMASKFRGALVMSSQSNVWICESGDCQVVFSTNSRGEVYAVEIRHGGQHLVAFRQRTGMIF